MLYCDGCNGKINDNEIKYKCISCDNIYHSTCIDYDSENQNDICPSCGNLVEKD